MGVSNLVWIHGKYLTALCRGYGGGERSIYMLKLLSKLLNVTRITHVVYAEPLTRLIGKGQCKNFIESNESKTINKIVSIKLTQTSILGRIFVKFLGKLGVINSKRSALRILTLNPSYKDLELIANNIDNNTLVVIDGIAAAKTVRALIRTLKRRSAAIIYLSHNFEADYYTDFKSYILKLEKECVNSADIVIAASIRDTERYHLEFNVKEEKLVTFPNIFPEHFKPLPRRQKITIAIVSGSSTNILHKLTTFIIKRKIVESIVYIGKLPANIARIKSSDVELINYEFIPSRNEYLSVLSQAHIGLNYSTWLGGTNVKRFDYALAGLAIFSGGTGYRGEVLPGEIAFTDAYDLASKIKQIAGNAVELGMKNKEHALRLHEKALARLKYTLRSLLG